MRSRRQDLHARIAKEIEIHFAEIGEQRPELLAHHATQAGLIERAVVQWGKAGRKSVSLSAMAEAVSQLGRGLELVPAPPDTPERQRLELELQSALGGALVASKGIAAPETGSAYARARVLCEQLGDSVALIPVLSGQVQSSFWPRRICNGARGQLRTSSAPQKAEAIPPASWSAAAPWALTYIFLASSPSYRMSVARLWRDQGEAGRGSRASRAVYGWFTEGFDSLDLKEAKGLLEELLL